ncbi:MAG: hypothetical protein JWP38_2280 [Herbaspirillum sp.]|nr:hypothetical protein [Herbaspirillum sp.]
MSISAMTRVWECFPRGGSEMLVALALADWCDNDGGSLYPSIGAVAKKVRVSESQARRIMHSFIDDGLLEVIGNHNGGNKGSSRRYRMNLAKLASTPRMDATPSADATPSTDARDGSHPCALPLAPMLAKPSLTINEPSGISNPVKTAPKAKLKKPRAKSIEETLQAFFDRCKAENVKAIPVDDPIFEYANTVGLSEVMLSVCWFVFKGRFQSDSKKQKDWRAHYRNAVKNNWFKLWFIGSDGTSGFTTAGQQAHREMNAGGAA